MRDERQPAQDPEAREETDAIRYEPPVVEDLDSSHGPAVTAAGRPGSGVA